MLSLNTVYDNDELFYYCNCCGDINIPGTDPMYCGSPDELPIKERNLYENYWAEGLGCWMYVVKYKDNPAMALSMLFDEGYLSDLLGKRDISDEDMKKFYHAISDYALMLERDVKVSGCDILVGENTDPDGHELMVIVPYEQRDRVEEIASYLYEVAYTTVEALM